MAQCIMELESTSALSKVVAEVQFDLVWLSIQKRRRWEETVGPIT